jgi:DNA polymerase kappa
VVEEIRKRIQEATLLTCSSGISCNKMLAKICTDMKKPDGQTYLKPDIDSIKEFMRKLSVRKIPGIGRMTELVLASLGIFTCQDILEKAVEIYICFSERLTNFLFRAALGISRNFHEEDDEDACQKSISVSSTFRPISTLEQYREKIAELCEELAERIDKRKIAGVTVTLELKSIKFEVV